MKIFDCTTYFEEDLMMDLRLNILKDFVDKFVVCEATLIHSGNNNKMNIEDIQKKITQKNVNYNHFADSNSSIENKYKEWIDS